MSRNLDISDLAFLRESIRSDVPGFEVGFKNKSALMKVLGFLAYPFNPDFMTSYVTTWGKKVYFPTESFFAGDPARSFRILAHEYVHLWDNERHRSFKVTYMLPQVLALLPLVVFSVLSFPHSWISVLPFLGYVVACGSARLYRPLFWCTFPLYLVGTAAVAWALSGYTSLILLCSVLFLIPWPSPWRTRWEIRGYGMNVALAQWVYGTLTHEYLESITRQFTGPYYMFMCWSSTKVKRELEAVRSRAETRDLQKEAPYDRVHSIISRG